MDTSRAGSTSGKGVKRKGDDEEYSSDTTVTSAKTADICDDQSSEDDSVDSAVFRRDSPLSPGESDVDVDPELLNDENTK